MMLRSWCVLLLLVSACAAAQERPVALKGTLVTPDEVVPDGTVLIRGGRIEAAGANVPVPPGAKIVETGGVIAPGLIDLHNHLTWNIFPRWKPNQLFGNRYDWQALPVYTILLDGPHSAVVSEGLECDAERYAEVKAITEGETSVVGGMYAACDQGLARNLDYDAELGKTAPSVTYNVFPLEMTETEIDNAQRALASGGALLIHLSEGAPNNASAEVEFAMLQGRGLLVPGVSLIHGVPFTAANFAAMKKAQVGFIWSPRSNIELYGATANVAAALANQVVTAIGPDWSPTGSTGMLAEMRYAAVWNAGQWPYAFDDHTLLQMATTNPARLVHLEKVLGQLGAGYSADILVLRRHGEQYNKNAWWTLDHSSPEDVQLVMVGGHAVYGDPMIMSKLADGPLESLTICGAEKRISFATEPGQQPSFAETEAKLRTALAEWGQALAPLAECGNQP